MAQPYQDLNGNWFMAGRPMSDLDIAVLQPGKKQVIPAPVPQAQQAAPIVMAPKAAPKQAPAQVDPIAAAMAEAERKKQFGANPLSGLGALFGF